MPRLVKAVVVEVAPATARMTLFRMCGTELAGLDWQAGQHVRVLVGPARTFGLRLPSSMRTYSVRSLVADELQLIGLDRGGNAPGEAWIRDCRIGHEVELFEPSGDLTIRPGHGHLFAGDETSVPAIAAMRESLPAGSSSVAVVEVNDRLDELAIPGVTYLHRHGRSPIASVELADAVCAAAEEYWDRSDGCWAYLTGEARTVQLVRRRLVSTLGWDRRQVVTKPFWAEGKSGLH